MQIPCDRLSPSAATGGSAMIGLGVVTCGEMARCRRSRSTGATSRQCWSASGQRRGVGAAGRTHRLRRDRPARRGAGGAAGAGARHGLEQRARVGMGAVVEQILRAPLLDDAPEIHHRDLVAEIVDHGEVVADQDVAQAELRPAGPAAG